VRVLITRLSSMGDIVHAWPMADALAAAGGFELAWAVEACYRPIIAGHPGIATAIEADTGRWAHAPLSPSTWRAIAALSKELRAFAPEVVLDPQGLVKSAACGWLSGAARRVGLARAARRELAAGAFYTERVAPPAAARHVVDINLCLLFVLGIDSPSEGVPDATFLLKQAPSLAWRPEAASIALVPGSGKGGKSWPPAAFSELARRLSSQGKPVLVLWGPGEEALARKVAGGAGAGVRVAPPTTVLGLAAALAGCAAVVGGDTGPVHLAAALGTPSLAIFLCTDPIRNGLRGRCVNAVVRAAAGARRGSARTRPLGTATVDEVEAALKTLLQAAVRERS
jgi:heptosyltransferase-1